MTLTLRHSDILTGGKMAHLSRATLSPARPRKLHDHDFYELFWVQNGTLRHHQPGGVQTQREGDLFFVRPEHKHGLQGRGEAPLIVSISFHPELILELEQRHPKLLGHLFWSSGPPIQRHLRIKELAVLNHAAVTLENSPCDALAAEAFLLPLCTELTRGGFAADMPGWLASACVRAKDQKVFRQGSAGLVEQTGKAHAHVSRMMRRHMGQTPSDYVNQQRMEFAARTLASDNLPVTEIAEACGLPNMSHFHKLFRNAHGMTPLQYRAKYQRQIVQPES